MEAISGVFDEDDAALRAGERAREVIRARSRVSVFLPKHGDVLEAEVVKDTSSLRRVSIVVAVLGAMGVLILALLGAPRFYLFLWVTWVVAGGLMLGSWLTGQKHERRMLRHAEHSRLARQLETGHALVIAIVDSAHEAQTVEQVFQSAGGHALLDHVASRASPAPSRSANG